MPSWEIVPTMVNQCQMRNWGLAKQSDAKVVALPHKAAVYLEAGGTQRVGHIRVIYEHGRMAWPKESDDGLRSRATLNWQTNATSASLAIP